MKFIEINKSLKENISNVYNLVGEDFFLIKQAIINIKSYTIKSLEEFNYQKFDANNMKSQELEPLLLGFPIENDYKLLVLENPNSEIVQFLNNFSFDPATIVVCVNADKLKVGEVVDCTKLDRIDINKYILNYLSKNKISISEQALDYLVDATNQNMSNINNELNKLSSFVGVDGNIDMQVATNLVSNSTEYAIYALTNAIDNKNYTQYETILNDMTKSQTCAELFSYLGKYFKRMQYLCLNKNDSEIMPILNIKPYAIKIARQNISKNGLKFYLDLYQKYIELDYQIKSGKITPQNALYMIVF